MLAGLAEQKPQLLQPRTECILGGHRESSSGGWWVSIGEVRRHHQLTFLKLADPRLAKTNRSAAQHHPKSDFRHRDSRTAPAPSTTHVPASSHLSDGPTQPPCRSAPAPASSAPSAQTTASSTPAAMPQQHRALNPPASPGSGTRPLAPRPSTSGTHQSNPVCNGRASCCQQHSNALSPSRTTQTPHAARDADC